jgi:hypothetical protein
VCIFKRPDGSYLTAVSSNYQGDPYWQPSLEFYAYRNGRLMDVTQATMPRRFNKSLGYQLPRYGTTIGVITEPGKRVYDLVWVKGRFHVKRTSQKRGEAPTRPLSQWHISGDEVGPIMMGMSEAAIRRIAIRHGLRLQHLRGPSVEFWGVVHEKRPTWKLVLSQGTKRLLVVHYDEEDRMHSPIEVIDPRFSTWEGARVGTRFRTLARLYQRGGVTKNGARLSVDFEDPRVFGTHFYLEGRAGAGLTEEPVNRRPLPQTTDRAQLQRQEEAWQRKAWQHLLRVNPRVTSIVISGH